MLVAAPLFPKEIHWIEGAGHVDLYGVERHVGPALEKLTLRASRGTGRCRR